MAEGSDPLVAVLLAHLRDPLRSAVAVQPDVQLEAQLAGMVARAQAAWRALALDPAAFVAYLGERIQGTDLAQALAAVHAEDLYLCCSCTANHPLALAAFDAQILSQVPAFLASQRATATQVDEVRQLLRERLLCGSAGGPGKLAEYTGRGPLAGWVRVAAVRTSLNQGRNMDDKLARREGADPGKLVGAADDPELTYLKRRYEVVFKAAVEEALATLPPEGRTFLQLHVDGLSSEQLGALFHISKATAHRRVAEARRQVQEQTLRLLQAQLRATPEELQSLVRLVRSDLHVSIARCLAGAGRT